MNNAYNLDDCGQPQTPRTAYSQNYVPRMELSDWRQPRPAIKNKFPPLDMIGADNSHKRAPSMERITNRSRSPMNLFRRPENDRSRTPSQDRSRPQISYPRPLIPDRDACPPRIALRNDSPPRRMEQQLYPPSPPHSRETSPPRPFRPAPPSPPAEDIYSPDLPTPSKPQLRLSPVPRQGPAPQEITPSHAPRPEEEIEYALHQAFRTLPRQIHRPRARLEEFQSDTRLDLIPKPLNLRLAPPSRKDVTSMCEYLSLDELENMWHSQDMYAGGNVTAPIASQKPPRSPIGFGIALVPTGPAPDLADHPAFRNDPSSRSGGNSFTCA